MNPSHSTSSSWRTFFTREPKFSVWIAILSIILLLGVVFCMRSPEGTSWFCTLPDLAGVKALVLRHQGV